MNVVCPKVVLMRYFEISAGMRIHVDAEEQAVLDRAIEARNLRPSDLDERMAEVARKMVTRGLLLRRKDDNGIYLTPNGATDLWRI